ncbi:MAG TPA: hypothetical protein VNW52_12470 [Burkholderiaceae bacterium]|nr:hypothetical protein [Burkholderiaceae bacterium]
MKIFVLASILGALSLTVVAQTSNNETVTIKASKSAQAQQPRGMAPDEFGRFTGSYSLSNGSSLALFSRGLKKYAALHGEAWHEIVATSSNSFVAVDKQLQMTIQRHENGEVTGELLIAASPDQVAAGKPMVRLALH